MTIIQSLCLAALIALTGKDFIKKHSRACFVATGVVAFLAIAGTWTGLNAQLPVFLRRYVTPMFTKGSLAGALFFFVMFAAAVPNGCWFMRRIMPVRGELSIMASILAFGHAAALGLSQMRHALGGHASALDFIALAIALALMVIRLPLFVTSFKEIRRKMQPKKWKKLQKWAYLFYALIFVHILTYNMASAMSGNVGARVNVIVYGAIFVSYAVMRVSKEWKKKWPDKARIAPCLYAAGGVIMAALAVCAYMPAVSKEPAALAAENAAAQVDDALALNDGEYVGKGVGYNGQMKVAVTVEGGKIAAIRVKSIVDDEEYVDMAEDAILRAVVAGQSTQVDAVSGATSTSLGLLDAIDDALNQAREAMDEAE